MLERFVLFTAYYRGRNSDIVAERKPETFSVVSRGDAVTCAERNIPEIARRTPVDFHEGGMLLVNEEGGMPVWSWTFNGRGVVLDQSCEYRP